MKEGNGGHTSTQGSKAVVLKEQEESGLWEEEEEVRVVQMEEESRRYQLHVWLESHQAEENRQRMDKAPEEVIREMR